MLRVHLFSKTALWAMLTGLWIGCFSPDRDNVADPYNSPIFRFFNAAYEPARGAVLVQWEYLSRGTPEQFEVYRKVGNQINVVGVIAGTSITEDQTQIAFQDTALIAGAAAMYWVRVTGAGGGLAQSLVNTVKIPGASLLETRSDPVNGQLRVSWAGDTDGLVGYEVFRRVAGGAESRVFLTENVGETSFVDSDIIGNTTYTYTVHSLMTNGIVLKSLPLSGAVYGQVTPSLTLKGASALNGSFRLYATTEFSSTPMQVLFVESNRTQLYRYYASTIPGLSAVSAWTPNVDGLAPESVSAAGVTERQASVRNINEAWIAGIHVNTGKAELRGLRYGFPDAALSKVWDAEAADTRTALALDLGWKRLFLTVGKTLRVLNEAAEEIGIYTIDAGQPRDLLVASEILWAVLPDERRLIFGPLAFSGDRLNAIAWQDAALPAGALPIAIAGDNYGHVIVLDAGNAQLLVLTQKGDVMLKAPLAGQDWTGGDLEADARGNQIFLVNEATKQLYVFRP